MAEKVFISHSHGDPEWVRRFAGSLRERGFDVWYAESSAWDDALAGAMEKAIRGSDLIVLLFDRDPPGTPILFFDMGAGIGMDKRMISILPAGLDEKRLPLPLRRRPHFVKETPEATAAKLLARAA